MYVIVIASNLARILPVNCNNNIVINQRPYFNNEIEQYDKLISSCDSFNHLNEVLKAIVDSYESNVNKT